MPECAENRARAARAGKREQCPVLLAPLRRLTNKILTEKAEEASESVTPLRAPLGFSGVRVLPSPQANKESEELQKISLIVLREQRGTWQELLSSSLTVLSPAGG